MSAERAHKAIFKFIIFFNIFYEIYIITDLFLLISKKIPAFGEDL